MQVYEDFVSEWREGFKIILNKFSLVRLLVHILGNCTETCLYEVNVDWKVASASWTWGGGGTLLRNRAVNGSVCYPVEWRLMFSREDEQYNGLSGSETGGLIWRRCSFLSAHKNKNVLCRSTLTFQPFGIHQWNQWFGCLVVFRLLVAFIIQGLV